VAGHRPSPEPASASASASASAQVDVTSASGGRSSRSLAYRRRRVRSESRFAREASVRVHGEALQFVVANHASAADCDSLAIPKACLAAERPDRDNCNVANAIARCPPAQEGKQSSRWPTPRDRVPSKPIVPRSGPSRSLLGESESRPPPEGREDRTSAFPESTRPRRHAVAVGAGAGCGRLQSVDSERQDRGGEVAKASVGQVCAESSHPWQARDAGQRTATAPSSGRIGDRLVRATAGPRPRTLLKIRRGGERPRVNGNRRSTRPREAD
jgi:hypothetical protein